jgi:DHA1 family multidrug resistance protein-like MFS transporter
VLWLVQFLTTLAMTLGLTFVPFFLRDDPVLGVRDEAARALYTGLILAGPFFTTILFTPLWGWVADRTGPKRQVVRACFGLGLTQLLMAAARSPDQMVAIRILQGVVSGVLSASLGLVATVTPKARQGEAIARLQSATPAGQIFGPVLGGVLATTLGFRATYALLGILILATGFLCWRLLRQDGFVPSAPANPFVALYRSGRQALAHPLLRQALSILLGGQFAFTIAQGVFAIYAGKLIAGTVAARALAPAWWSTGVGFTALAMTVTGLANFLGSPWWGRLHDRRVPLLTPAGLALLAGSLLLLVVWPPWWAVLLARAGIGLGVGATSTLQFAVVSGQVAPEERGQFMGLATALSHVGNLAGFVLGGVLAAWWSEVGNFALAAAAYGVVMIAALRLELATRVERPLFSAPGTRQSGTRVIVKVS